MSSAHNYIIRFRFALSAHSTSVNNNLLISSASTATIGVAAAVSNAMISNKLMCGRNDCSVSHLGDTLPT
jgi:hypothetical protein